MHYTSFSVGLLKKTMHLLVNSVQQIPDTAKGYHTQGKFYYFTQFQKREDVKTNPELAIKMYMTVKHYDSLRDSTYLTMSSMASLIYMQL